jgi:hypothetical protein
MNVLAAPSFFSLSDQLFYLLLFVVCCSSFSPHQKDDGSGVIMTPRVMTFLDETGAPVDKEVRSIHSGGRFMCALVARKWITDRETKVCMSTTCKSNTNGVGGATFTTFLRRHHCRNCGGVYCEKCSQNKVPILALRFITPVRVCDTCFGALTNLD